MAQIAYEQINQESTYSPNNVGFFFLQNDGEEAIVRFAHDSIMDFDIQTVHNVTVNGKYRNVSCLRDPHEPLEKCPFCANGFKLNQRFYIHLVQYSMDSAGNIVAEPKVWERSVQYANTLKSYIDNYGPLSDLICKIIRHGAKGDMKTTYEIVPNLSKQLYPDNIYVKDMSAFEGYTSLGTVVMDKSYDDCLQYVNTKAFPQAPVQQQAAAPQQNYAPQNAMPTYSNQQSVPQQPVPQIPHVAPQAAPQYQAPPQPNQGMSAPNLNIAENKPTRYY